MKRRLFTILAAVSLTLCVATVALWACQPIAPSLFLNVAGRSVWEVNSSEYGIDVQHFVDWPEPPKFSIRKVIETPTFAVNWVGASRKEWGKPVGLYFARGTTAVALKADGTVDWNFPITEPQAFQSARFSPLLPFWEIKIPHRVLVVLWAIFPTCLVIGRVSVSALKRARTRIGLCPECGYNMRATPARCPECGAVPMGTKVTA
jgi:hypothetical protein